jgi:hypothetical protein
LTLVAGAVILLLPAVRFPSPNEKGVRKMTKFTVFEDETLKTFQAIYICFDCWTGEPTGNCGPAQVQ